MAGSVRLCLNRYLDEHHISRYWLAKKARIEYPVINRYYKNKVVRYDSNVLAKICDALQCQIEDILEYVDE
ncbi:helix-turn-helix domain-containing protein [Zongyangia hominis]|nr:helix-turn-helix transcriptional regulator [Zongyangia hominis]